ncbi:unnamed protein product, partial [Nesidiocoris tenuis]
MGFLHPHILTPHQLVDALSEAKNHLRNGTRFPVPINLDQAHNVLKTLRITAYFSEGKLVCLLNIPIVRTANFNYYHVAPLPFWIENNTYGYIHPEEPYFLVNRNQTEFTILSEFELSRCYSLDNGYDVICKNPPPLLELPSTTLCLASLFYLPNVLPLSCETRIVNVNSPLWRQLKVGNSWVFCVPDDAEIKIKCPTIVDRTVLTGIGIFSINPACVGYTPLYTLTPRRSA